MIQRLKRLVDHLGWANRRALKAVRNSSDPEARRLLSHVLAAERVWLARIETGDSSELEIWPELSLSECADLLERNIADLRRLLAGRSEADLKRRIGYRNSKGEPFETPLEEILLHLLLHGTYHRGQIALRLRDAGDEPVNTDFVTFVRESPAAEG